MKSYTINQIRDIQKKQKYLYIGMQDEEGNTIVPFSTNKTTPATRLNTIETRLASPGLPDGEYYVVCKNSVLKTVPPDKYLIIKGKPTKQLQENAPAAAATSIPIKEDPADPKAVNFLSYEAALELRVLNEKLLIENLQLEKEVAELKSYIEELEGEQDESILSESNDLLSQGKTFLNSLMEFGAPLIDQYFDQKNKDRDLREKQLRVLAMQIKQQQQPMQVPQEKHQDANQVIINWISSYQKQPELYNQLAEIYNQADSQENFYELLVALDKDLYQELLNQLNG